MPYKALPKLHAAGLALGLSLAAAIAFGSPAAAVTLGSLAPPNSGGCGNCNVLQWKSAPGEPSYEVPPGKWTITSWTAQGGGVAAGKARLRVYRPTGTKRQLKLVKQSAYGKIPADGHPQFATSLKVRGGDLIGVYTVDNVPSAYNAAAGKTVVWAANCDTLIGDLVGRGSGCKPGLLKGYLANIEVTLSKL